MVSIEMPTRPSACSTASRSRMAVAGFGVFCLVRAYIDLVKLRGFEPLTLTLPVYQQIMSDQAFSAPPQARGRFRCSER